jgi:PEP-CTERM motif
LYFEVHFLGASKDMKLSLAVLAATLLSPSAAFAGTVTLNFATSGYQVPISSTGLNGSNLGVYQVHLGSCLPDITTTTCTFGGAYTSTDPDFLAGNYTITTTYQNGEVLSGLQDGVGADTFHIDSAPSDANSTIVINDAVNGIHSFSFISGGTLLGSLDITGFTNKFCTNDSDCTVSGIAQNPADSFEGQPTANFTFDDANTVGPVPEPASLALLGTGAVSIAGFLLRRRTHAA